MTVMCRLVRGKAHHGTTQVLCNYVLQRNSSDMVNSRLQPMPNDPSSGNSKSQTNKSFQSRNAINPNYLPYMDLLEMRREQASRSVLVEIEVMKDSAALRSLWKQIGIVNKYFLYRNSGKNFVLMEFKNIKSKNDMINYTHHSKDPHSIPVSSPFFYLRNLPANVSGDALPDCTVDVQFHEETLVKELRSINCKDDMRLATEMKYLHSKSMISDLSTRLRFFTCHQLDVALGGSFLGIRALPFGSSVSGFGRNDGDLDIYLEPKKNQKLQRSDNFQLFFHSKSWIRNRNLHLKLFGDLISVILPGCTGVVSILSARVPIIKYHQTMTNLQCDLQNSCPSGVDFSHLMWVMNSWDERVAPLAYTLKVWSGLKRVCCVQKPGPFVTNFSMTILLIFFLQSENILPSLRSFSSLPDDMIFPSLDPNSALVFPNLRKVNHTMLSAGSDKGLGVDDLLYSFFDFYTKFDFAKNRLSIYHGTALPKQTKASLEIQNPINPQLNVSHNVTQEGLEIFLKAVKEALNALGKDYRFQNVDVLVQNQPRLKSLQRKKGK